MRRVRNFFRPSCLIRRRGTNSIYAPVSISASSTSISRTSLSFKCPSRALNRSLRFWMRAFTTTLPMVSVPMITSVSQHRNPEPPHQVLDLAPQENIRRNDEQMVLHPRRIVVCLDHLVG